MTDTPIGFIGIGAMGKPMAINIRKAALPLAVADPNETATASSLHRALRSPRTPAPSLTKPAKKPLPGAPRWHS